MRRHHLVETITEIFKLAAATAVWAAVNQALSFWLWVFVATVATLVAGWIFALLEEELPEAVNRPNIAGLWLRRLLQWMALVSIFCAMSLSWALHRARDSLPQVLDRFEQELTGREARAWQRETFSLAAERVARLGPSYEAATEEARRGGLSLPVPDAAAAKLVYEAAVEKTLEQWRGETQWHYRLWAMLQHGPAVRLSLATAPAVKEATTTGSDPMAAPLIRAGITDAMDQVASRSRESVSDLAATKLVHLWLPAGVSAVLAFLALCAAAHVRLSARIQALKRLP